MPAANQVMSTRVLFAGGCHVVGYPVGDQSSFPRICATQLEAMGYHLDLSLLAHLPLHRPETLLRRMDEFSPDVLVLQVGHFELGRRLADLLRWKKQGKSRRSSSSTPPQSYAESTFDPWFRPVARCKRFVDWMTGHRVVDLDAFHRSLRDFAQVVADSSVTPFVLLISPLPCLDPVTSYYRRHATPFYGEVAESFGWHYLQLEDFVHSGPPGTFGLAETYADAVHLGRPAQQEVARQVSHRLLQILPAIADGQMTARTGPTERA